MNCEGCAYLDKSRVRYDKVSKEYCYGCTKKEYIPFWCKNDRDLSKQGCSHFRDRKVLTMYPGDIFSYLDKKDHKRYIYLYCGVVYGKRLLYGGKKGFTEFEVWDLEEKARFKDSFFIVGCNKEKVKSMKREYYMKRGK